MGRQFRVRVRGKNAPAKIRKGSSSSSCPTYSKNRDIAKVARNALRQRLVAIEERPENDRPEKDAKSRRPLIDNVLAEPLEGMNIEPNRSKRKRTRSMVSFNDYQEEVEIEKEVEPYANVILTSAELETKLSRIGQMLSSAVNTRTKQRSNLLAEIRSILKEIESLGSSAEHVEVLSRYAKSFLPLFFRIYTDVPDATNERPPDSAKTLKLSAFETIRIYMTFVSQELAGIHVDLALKKLEDNEISDERKLLVVDIIISLCKRVGVDAASKIFTQIRTWFLSDPTRKSLQKKAYRILVELYKRRDDSTLDNFFESIRKSVVDILRLENNAISEPAWASRLAVFRLIMRSLGALDECRQFYDTVFPNIIFGMDRSHNSLARKNAAKCFIELIDKMIELAGNDEDKNGLQILDSVESCLFVLSGFKSKSSEIPLEHARSTLISMNIFAQRYLKAMNGALVNRFLNHSIVFLGDNRPVIRVLAIRLMRVFCNKLPPFMITQFQDYILESVFSNQPESENTGTIRRANRFLFGTLIEKFGYEVVSKYVNRQEGLLKFLKKLEKVRRRKLAPPPAKSKSSTRSTVNEEESDSEAEDRMTAASRARTICADSIFKLLEESDDTESDEDDDDAKSHFAKSMVSIKEFRKALHKSEAASRHVVVKAKKLPKGLHIAEDGRLIVEDPEANHGEEGKIPSEDENDY